MPIAHHDTDLRNKLNRNLEAPAKPVPAPFALRKCALASMDTWLRLLQTPIVHSPAPFCGVRPVVPLLLRHLESAVWHWTLFRTQRSIELNPEQPARTVRDIGVVTTGTARVLYQDADVEGQVAVSPCNVRHDVAALLNQGVQEAGIFDGGRVGVAG